MRTYLYTAYLPGAYYKLDRIDEAAATEERTLALARKRYGPSHHRVATARNGLGVMESERHHLDKAEAYMQQALAMREKLLRPAHPDCAISLGGLAAVATEQGRPAVAETYLLRALAIDEAAMGRPHTDVAGDLVRLADAYLEQDAPARAAPALVRAWAIRRDAPVSLERKCATAQRLARVYRKLVREPDALALDAWLAANDGGHN